MLNVAVCVPVRNEVEALPALLAGLAAQARHRAALTVCIALDHCTDGSGALLTEATLPFPLHIAQIDPPGPPNAGRARRAAMAAGLAALDGRDGLLLTTDADSVPAPDWTTAAIHALAHADVAAGRILRDGGVQCVAQDRIETYYDALHALRRRIDPVSWEDAASHHQTGGANLAFRTDVYRALGGFPALPSGEDAQIVDDAARAGFRVRRDAAMRVRTSWRRIGRAPSGLAAALSALDGGADATRVAHPADAAWQYRRHAQARAAFARLDDPAGMGSLMHALGLSADHIVGVARDCPNAEAFAMRIVPMRPDHRGAVPLAEAETALAALSCQPHALNA